jgi:hypothetical protein
MKGIGPALTHKPTKEVSAMSQEHSIANEPPSIKSKEKAFKAFQRGEMEASEFINIYKGIKKYLPSALQDLGPFSTATAIYTDNKPLPPDGGHAILIDRQGKCWFRSARVEGDKVVITAWEWPHGETAVPLNHFKTIERVSSISS